MTFATKAFLIEKELRACREIRHVEILLDIRTIGRKYIKDSVRQIINKYNLIPTVHAPAHSSGESLELQRLLAKALPSDSRQAARSQ